LKDGKNKDNEKGNAKKYDKIRHLVEVDDDIHAVFMVTSSQMDELYIAKDSPVNKSVVGSIFNEIRHDAKDEGMAPGNTTQDKGQSTLGKMKWVVLEYENYRILKIYEQDKIVVVVINSNTQLEHTVDNILGYYYDMDDVPKSLF
jgi:hypothetical protein